MDINIKGNRVQSVSNKLDVLTIARIQNKFEGLKKFLGSGHFSFENTPHNINLWMITFPDAKINDLNKQSEILEQFSRREKFEFKTKPYKHQKEGFEKLKDRKCFAILAEQGTGKSKLLTDLIGYKWCEGEIDAVIILSPKGVHFQWVEEQLPTHMSEVVPYKSWAWNNTKKELQKFEDMMDGSGQLEVVTMNLDAIKYGGFDFLKKFIKKHKGKVLMAIDEAHMIKTYQAERTKKAIELGGLCDVRGILTGTPIAKNIADLFSQYKFLDERVLGFKYFKGFKAQYCEVRWNGFGEEIIGAKNLEQLYQRLDPVSLRATKSELDLPPKMYDEYAFDLSDEQKRAYKEIKTQFLTQLDKDEKVSVTNAASAITRLQQISSGYLPKEDGSIHLYQNPRLDALKSIIETIDGKVIVWARFNHDIEIISKTFGKEAVSYYGGTSTEQREQAIKKFMDPDSEVRFFVSNPAAGGTGLNLQGLCTTAIYYTNDYNAVSRWQSEDRIHRIGTKGTCTYIDLVARGTVDKRILSNLRSKKALSDLALDEVRKMFE